MESREESMEIQFVPIKNPRCVLPKISCSEYFFQEIICRWIGDSDKKKITIGGLQTGGSSYPVLISLENGKQLVAVAEIPRSVLNSIPGHGPLPEKVQEFADQEGYTVDGEWLEDRNDRLGISYHDDADEYIIPAQSAGALISAYAAASCAQIIVHRDVTSSLSGYRLQLHFFGDESGRGWQEELLLEDSDLRRFCRQAEKISLVAGMC
jgi:hypothetical protein